MSAAMRRGCGAGRDRRAPGQLLRIQPDVARALQDGRPVVALESTLITHGLPYPDNLAAARACEAAVSSAGAVPATIAVGDGSIRIGLAEGELEALATADGVPKVTRQNLAGELVASSVSGSSGWGGTSVSASLIAAELAGIAVFATGGIGGVHRGGQQSLDISADLDELSRSPVAVVCAGPKSILDVGRTLEVLETRGVPVVGWQSDDVAGFFSQSSGHHATLRVEDAAEAARLILLQRELGLGGMLITVPLPAAAAMDREEVEAAITQASDEAIAAGVRGAATTPWVLARVAALTAGRTIRANLALLENDATVAAAIAVALSGAGAARSRTDGPLGP